MSASRPPAWTKGSPLLVADAYAPEHLPGEPRPSGLPTPALWLLLPIRVCAFVMLGWLTAPLWSVYSLGFVVRGGRPPNVPPFAQFLRYARLVWTASPGHPGLGLIGRLWMSASLLRKLAVVPVWGSAWMLDELLFRARLRKHPVRAPLIEISAGRSGSTQLARYLEQDPALAAPSLMQFTFPYLWLWILMKHTLGRVLSVETIHSLASRPLSPELLQRHEFDPLKTDSFSGALYLSHLNGLAPLLGPEAMIDDFGFGAIAPHNRVVWERDFMQLVDGIGRKTLAFAGRSAGGAPRRFFFKGHFLCAGPLLAERYPEARFVTMIRHPAKRMQSALNHLRANPFDGTLGPAPWAWLAESIVHTEVTYCEVEKAWFSAGERHCVLRFSDYVADLEGAMRKVYRECLDQEELPAHVPREHTPRDRTSYLIDRSLADVGIDEEAVCARLAEYIEWCQSARPKAS